VFIKKIAAVAVEELLANVQMDFALLLPGHPNALVMGQWQTAPLFFQMMNQNCSANPMVHISLEFANWLLTEKHTDRERGKKPQKHTQS